jgi:predicted flap endonuclease-1-like 5' DNA nuclease
MRKQHNTGKLEDIPNIGKSIASDLRTLGILTPQQLATRDPLKTPWDNATIPACSTR